MSVMQSLLHFLRMNTTKTFKRASLKRRNDKRKAGEVSQGARGGRGDVHLNGPRSASLRRASARLISSPALEVERARVRPLPGRYSGHNYRTSAVRFDV